MQAYHQNGYLNNLPKMGLYATAGATAPISALASAMLYAGTSKPAMGALPEESLKDTSIT
jgi:hypothetical protein